MNPDGARASIYVTTNYSAHYSTFEEGYILNYYC